MAGIANIDNFCSDNVNCSASKKWGQDLKPMSNIVLMFILYYILKCIWNSLTAVGRSDNSDTRSYRERLQKEKEEEYNKLK